MDSKNIQGLVDEHAKAGFDDVEIRKHLRLKHGVSAAMVIPPPSPAVKKARSRRGNKIVLTYSLGEQDAQDGSDHIHQDKHPAIRMTPESIPMPPEREKTEAEIFQEFYVGVGVTHLDRWIHGLGRWLSRDEKLPRTHFETFNAALQDRRENDIGVAAASMGSMYAYALGDEVNSLAVMDLALAPWFDDQHRTINIQIDSEMAEHFMSMAKAPTTAWVEQLCRQAFYVDIKASIPGQRMVSAIYVQPSKGGKSFEYMAVLEWAGQGFEALVVGDYETDAQVMRRLDDDDLPPEAMDAMVVLYEPLHRQIMQILSMARMRYDELAPRIQELQYLDRRTDLKTVGQLRVNEKKSAARTKTHSYFRVLRMSLPRGTDISATRGRNSWSLDHLVTVSGHFRWQAYGPGMRQHKLIWIDAYDKGSGGRHRPAMNPELIAA